MAIKNSIIFSGFPRMSMQPFKGQMMLMPKNKKEKNMKLNKSKNTMPKGFTSNIVWMDMKPSKGSQKQTSKKKK